MLARFISYLFHPLFAPLISVYILFQLPLLQNYKMNAFYHWYVYGVMTVNLVIAPLLISFYFKRKATIQSLAMQTAKERRLPFLVTFIFYLITLVMLYFIRFPITYLKIFAAASLALLVLYFLTLLNQKVSTHLCGLGGICGMLFVISQLYNVDVSLILILFILLAGITASARMVLNAHTLKDLAFGFALGFFTQWVISLPIRLL